MPRQYRLRRPNVEQICRQCGTTFMANAAKVEDGIALFCDWTCYRAAICRPIEERLRTEGEGDAAHWLWDGPRNRAGYGRLASGADRTQGGKMILAHRAAWEIATGRPVPRGMDVLHACDIPACTRNDEPGIYFIRGIYRPRFGHLWLGTHRDNMVDMAEKGRRVIPRSTGPRRITSSRPRGERHGQAVLTEPQVVEIITRLRLGGITQAALAAEYGVRQATIGRIATGQTWMHVPRDVQQSL